MTDVEKRLADERKVIEERVAKAYEHETPTPTQAENDAAKLAALNQPDTPPVKETKPAGKASEAQPTASSYSTRSSAAKSE